MQAFIVAADALDPNIIQKYRTELPAIDKMMSSGMFMPFYAYTGWNYKSAYKSEQNWATILTGLSPFEHNINNKMGEAERPPMMNDLTGQLPFWEVLNSEGIDIGLWHTDLCSEPVSIYGYSVSAYYKPIETPLEKRDTALEIQLCEKDKWLMPFLDGPPPAYIYPQTLAQLGYKFEELRTDPLLAEQVIEKYHYQESIAYFEYELKYFFGAMARTQRTNPVDVLWFATPSTDRIAHFSMYNEHPDVLLEIYKLLDRYIGDFIDEFKPDITVLISDHGQQNYIEFVKCSNENIRREAFDSRDNVIWLKNGNVALEGSNGALLFTSHAPLGTFIMSGNDIQHCELHGMRTVDIYPTLLEALKIKVPANRSGYVADAFNRDLVNIEKLLPRDTNHNNKTIAFIQSNSVGLSERFISEIFLENRFADIIVIGEEKYREIFLNNPRVKGFMSFEEYESRIMVPSFDGVFVGVYNQTTNFMKHIRIK